MRAFLMTVWTAAAISAGACARDGASPLDVPPDDELPVAAVQMTPDTGTLIMGDSVQVKVTVRGLTSSAVTFQSSNERVATVSASGWVHALGAGVVLITAASVEKPNATDATLLSIQQRPAPNQPVHLEPVGGGRVRAYLTAEVAVAGSFAYTTTLSGFGGPANKTYVWNISSDQPALVDSLDLGEVRFVGDAHVSDDESLLLLATDYGRHAGVSVYSLANPARPQLMSRWYGDLRVDTIPTSTRGTHTAKFGRVNGKLYIFAAYVPEVVILDASNPRELKRLNTIDAAGWEEGRARGQFHYTHDVQVRDGILFTADWSNGVGIWDVGGARGGSPANPKLISRAALPGAFAHNVWWLHDQRTGSKQYLFVGDEGPGAIPVQSTGDVHVIDISNLSAPRSVAFLHVEPGTTSNGETAGPHNFGADEESGILYAAFYNGGVRAIDGRGDLANCEGPARARDGRCDLRLMGREVGRGLTDHGQVGIWGVVYRRGRLYAADIPYGLRVLDASPLRR